jgi:NAD(P)H-flavin reductase
MSQITVAERVLAAGVASLPATIRKVKVDAYETYTFWVDIADKQERRAFRFEPGQINMLGVFGVGEVPISISSDPDRPHHLAHTVRACGRVTNALKALGPGDEVTVRGPFGRPWPLRNARGGDLLVVAGGLGLAPVRPAMLRAIRHRGMFRRVILLVGARSPEHMLFRDELDAWEYWFSQRGVEIMQTVDIPDDMWPYDEGVVTALFPQVHLDPRATTVFTCGPEIMMWFAVRELLRMGTPPKNIWVSLERNMHCGVGICGHCQLGRWFLCTDGPVFRWDTVSDLLEVDEL